MRPNTLAEAVERIQAGSAQDIELAEFVDTFDLAKTDQDRYASIEREPKLTGDARLDALVGAIAEYLAKQRRLGRVPPWVSDPARRLASPWFTTASPSDAMREYLIFAIDGPAASGKGTLGKRLAHHYGYRHLDTGVIYRAVAKALMDAGADLTNETLAVSAALELDPEKFGNPALKTQIVGDAASVVSAFPKLREVLLNFQRQFAADPPGAVLDGRDIGTVICPHADVKIFVVADPKVRARRRTLEARARGEDADEAAVLADILIRDERDQNRAVAPLKPAPDAHLLDNTHLDIESGVRAAIDIVEAVRAGRQRV